MKRVRFVIALTVSTMLIGLGFYEAPAANAATPHVTATALVHVYGVYVRGEGGCWNYMGHTVKLVTRVQLYPSFRPGSPYPRTQSAAKNIANTKPLNYQDAWYPEHVRTVYIARVDCLMWNGKTWVVKAGTSAKITTGA